MSKEKLENLLKPLNRKYRKNNIHPRQRPFLAFKEVSKKFNTVLTSGSMERINNWFVENTAKGSHAIGPLFRGVYYFDGMFWPLDISTGYGEFAVYIFESLTDMSTNLKNEIEADKEEFRFYGFVWADCTDYAYGYDDLLGDSKLRSDAIILMKSANEQLIGIAPLLIQSRPLSRAMENCKLSIEMFLKAIIVDKAGWTDKKLKDKIFHTIPKAVNKVIDLTNNYELHKIKNDYLFFSNLDERYKAKTYSTEDLWRGYVIAQRTAAIFTRMYSDKDCRPTLFGE